ncbi:IS66 family transposase [Microbacterium sp.]|uniref:IS66 family transposase n=1 Tax=Microbacterium sp. TaxID=51671 RepID=UPI003A8892F4
MTPAVRGFVDSLLATIAAQQATIAAQQATIAAQQATIDRLQRRIDELERRLGMNSGNSSRPPSTDGPEQTPVKAAKPVSGRKRGGQPGHAKHSRRLIPTAECADVQHHRPHACSDCGARLRGDDPHPQRHQVTDLPPIQPIVVEHQVHTLTCHRCGCRCAGALPATVPRGAFGPRVVATVTLLTGLGRLSQRLIAQTLRDLFQLDISDGQISRLQRIGRTALQAAHEDITADVRSSAAVNVDETGWRQDGRRAWMWTVVGRRATLLAIQPQRSRRALRALLGEAFGGLVGSDRYSAYSHLEDERHQFCWAHLLRDFQAMIDRGGAAGKVGTVLKASGQELIHHWNRLQREEIVRATFEVHYRRLRGDILDALEQGTSCGEAKTAETCRRLLNECYSLFVFVHHAGVSPTNNAAERALRKSVIYRKLSFGTESKSGSLTLSVILSVIETCRRLGRDALSYLHSAVKAHFHHQPTPKLIPPP